MRNTLFCLWLIIACPLTGCHWRGERAVEAKSPAGVSTEEKIAPASAYSQKFLAYEQSITEILNRHKIKFAIQEHPHLQVGIAKFLLAKIIKSDSGLIIILGTPTEWEGVVPPSGVEFSQNGTPTGIQINNFSTVDDALFCFFTYGQIDDAAKKSLMTTIRRIELSDH